MTEREEEMKNFKGNKGKKKQDDRTNLQLNAEREALQLNMIILLIHGTHANVACRNSDVPTGLS